MRRNGPELHQECLVLKQLIVPPTHRCSIMPVLEWDDAIDIFAMKTNAGEESMMVDRNIVAFDPIGDFLTLVAQLLDRSSCHNSASCN